MVKPLPGGPKEDEIEARRANVATLRLAGYTQRDIAEELGVTPFTVNRDLMALRQRWAEEQGVLEDEFLLDLRRVEMALQGLATQVVNGDLAAIDRWIRLLERRARMFGYDMAKDNPQITFIMPALSESVSPDQIQGLSDEELIQIIQNSQGRLPVNDEAIEGEIVEENG